MIPLVAPTITERDRSYVSARIDAGLLEGGVGEAESFERAFARRLGRVGGVAVNSGTSALLVALRALGIGPGDDVLVPSYTCVALLHAVEGCGANTVLVDNIHDVRLGRFDVEPAAFRAAATPATKAVIVSHMFGTVASLPDELGLPIVEDFTLSLGAADGARAAGSGGTIGVCSLHESKMISCGRGGMIVADDDALLARLRQLVDYDADLPAWRFRPSSSLRGRFEPLLSLAMSELQAALGNSQLAQLDEFVDRRRSVARRYTNAFRGVSIECPDVPEELSNVFFRYLVATDLPVVEALNGLRAQEIEAGRGVFPPIHVLTGAADEAFPGATWCTDRLVSVPVHPSLDDEEVDMVERAVLLALGT